MPRCTQGDGRLAWLDQMTDPLDGAEVDRAGAWLVGRDRELQALDEALWSARAGHGRLVLVGGEIGIGKTALV